MPASLEQHSWLPLKTALDKSVEKPLLILDLDETLIHGCEKPLSFAPDFKADIFFVYKRPYLTEFLEQTSEFYDLAVWSAASKIYVEIIAETIFPGGLSPKFVWSGNRCTRKYDFSYGDWYALKDLKKVKKKGFELERTLIIEDEARKVERNYGNAIYIEPFEGDPEDRELLYLENYLLSIKEEKNFRKLEKRGWRNRQTLSNMDF